ncbi:plant UBX domain-containing protein 1 [Aristolochia californica]|uniref:plant UBX domain-containing protein 1 n=1 Tax=Aristolochia californica TaxID=171875 RepID=UPI0035DD0A6D
MHLVPKRRRILDPMEADAAKAKLAAVAEELGREVRVFPTTVASVILDNPSSALTSSADEDDDFFEFTAADYYRILSTKKEDKFLKTRKIRESEEAARRSRMTKSVIRVRFPDNYTLEAKFHSSETIQSLIDLLRKVVARPDLPFYIYTTPPKQQLKDMSMDLYTAGFVPGAIVFFSYDALKVDENAAANSGPFLRDDIRSLNGLDFVPEQEQVVESAPEPVAEPPPNVPEVKPATKKSIKPKWLKM